ncbi:hypothetical protein [Hymenobacter cellulosilyticus]|uniref:Uncharacterized protein n=1 Tax=Hymenobacter cellulosilyticus TaxID=2932248 RepID=A0A8T9Q590_9BACT|nr:hypothetical protein [Hymenobacter cellulosilyticus]UOQ70950.1 hypothetical protein MUN79_20065 [Hymenobacter cellulosilyticus]
MTTKQRFDPVASLNPYYKWDHQPSVALLDAADKLWIGFDRGEWGGNLHVFDTKQQTFVAVAFRDTLACLPLANSFCLVGAQLYVAGGVAGSSCITRFENLQAKHVFHSNYKENYRIISYGGTPRGEDIRAIAYSLAEQCLYYYSDQGIFRAKSATELAKAETWQLVCAPDVFSNHAFPSTGSEMGFTADNKLVLLVQSSAIGIWDGQVLRLIP